MKEIDDTPVTENESEPTLEMVIDAVASHIARLEERIGNLEVEVADLHHRRRVSRQQANDQDPEWYP